MFKMHQKPLCNCFGHWQVAAVACRLHWRHWLVCKHLWTTHQSSSENVKSVRQTRKRVSVFQVKVTAFKLCCLQQSGIKLTLKANILDFWFASYFFRVSGKCLHSVQMLVTLATCYSLKQLQGAIWCSTLFITISFSDSQQPAEAISNHLSTGQGIHISH